MHKRLMGFLNDQKVLYKKQFGFQKKISTAHAVISLIENIEKAIDNKKFVCGVFVDLQKAFDTVDHNILLLKFPQSFHFADDTCLLNIQNTISKINRSLNMALKEFSFWLNTNKIALNVAKTEVMLFKTKHKPCDADLRLKLCRKRLYKKKYLRYLGIKVDENLNWKIHIHDLASKLNRANAILAKLRHFVNSEILRSTYFAIFHSHLNYVCIAWGLTGYPQQKVSILQKKH